MSGLSRILKLLLVGAVCACAPPSGTARDAGPLQTPERFVTYFRADAMPHRSIVEANVAAVWRVVPEVFRSLGYPGAPAANTREHHFLTPNMQITGRLYQGESNAKYLDCGHGLAGPRADAHEVQFVIITRVREVTPTQTAVETIIDGSARDRITSGSSRCTGTGVLERTIAELITQRISGSR